MAVRTTPTAVKIVIDTSLEDNAIESFITTANLMVNKIFEDVDLGEDLMAEIEKWLAAHLIASSRERAVTREEVDGVRIDYAGNYGKNLESTPYGQVVSSLDTTGKMASIGLKQAGLWSVSSDY